MPPPGYEPFLRAICANPDDDTVRLVYADWLDENGDPERAEFIRLQVELFRAPESSSQQDAQTRCAALLQEHGRKWTDELPQLPRFVWLPEFRRGFIETICVAAGTKWFIEHRKCLFQSTPARQLTLAEAGHETLTKILAVREVSGLTGLTLARCQVRRGQFRALTHCPRLTKLRELAISGRSSGMRNQNLTDEEAQEFVETPFLPALEAIYFHDWINPVAERLLRTRFKIVKSRYWPNPIPPLGNLRP